MTEAQTKQNATHPTWRNVVAPTLNHKGWTRKDLAYHAGVDDKTLERAEQHGFQGRRASTIRQVAGALEVPISKLVPVEELDEDYASQLDRLTEQMADVLLILQAIAAHLGIDSQELAGSALEQELAEAARHIRTSSGNNAAAAPSPGGTDRSQPAHG